MSGSNYHRALAFLKHGALVRDRDGWRFGLSRVGDSVVDQLIASGRVVRLDNGGPGDCIVLSSCTLRRSAA